MNRKISITLALIVALALGGCNNARQKGNQKSSENKKEVIKIGAILPLTGDIAVYGSGCKNGIDLAIDQLNKDDLTVSYKIIYIDNQGNTKNSVTALNRLISQGIKIVIGPVTSSSALALVPLINKNKILLFSPTASSPELSGQSKYFLRLWPSDNFEAEVMASYVANILHIKALSTIYVNNDYGQALNQCFIKNFEGHWNNKVFSSQGYMQNENSFRNIITKVIDSKSIKGIYMIGYHKDLALLTKQIREYGFKGQLLASSNFETQELIDMIGNYADNVIYATPSYSDTTNNLYVKFNQKYLNKFHENSTIFSRNGYDIMELINIAITHKNFENDSIINYIKSMSYHGVSGDIRFKKDGDVIKPVAIKTVKNKNFQLIKIYKLANE